MDGDSAASLSHLSQCLTTPHRKNVCPCVQMEFCVASLVPIISCPEQSLAPSSLHPPRRYLSTLVRSPRAFLSSPSPLSSSSWQMLQSLYHLCGPSLHSLNHTCLVLGRPKLHTVLHVRPHQYFDSWQIRLLLDCGFKISSGLYLLYYSSVLKSCTWIFSEEKSHHEFPAVIMKNHMQQGCKLMLETYKQKKILTQN